VCKSCTKNVDEIEPWLVVIWTAQKIPACKGHLVCSRPFGLLKAGSAKIDLFETDTVYKNKMV